MAARETLFGSHARLHMAEGIHELAAAVKITLGPVAARC